MISETRYRKQALNICLALIPILAMSCFYYGPRVLILAVLSVASAVVADYICLRFQGERNWKKNDFSSLITGLLFVVFLPASIPYWLVIFGSVFAMVVVRHPFGGHYNTMFSPAITAYAFVIICWTDLVTHYPSPMTMLPLSPTVSGIPLGTSPGYRLMLGGAENIDALNALLGNFKGPLGATCILVLVCCGIFLAVRKTILWQIPVATFSIVAFFAFFFPRINGSRFSSVILELISGVLLLSVFFVAAIDNKELSTSGGKWIYGIILGLFVVLFRNLSKIELVCPFAIIIMNAIDHKCDDYAKNILYYGKTFFTNTWLLLKWACLKIGKFSIFLWDKFSDLLQKLVDNPKK